MSYADLVVKSNAVFTAKTDEPFQGGVAIIGNRIAAVGSDIEIQGWIGPETKVLEYGDELIMPGFNDSHFHLIETCIYTNPEYCVDLSVCKSEEECAVLVKEYEDTHSQNEWIFGVGWNHWLWDKPMLPNKLSLDKAGINKPVCLQSWDLHSSWINTPAIEAIGINPKTPDPEGSSIGRLENGEPSGFLSEKNATWLAVVPALTLPVDKLKTVIADLLKRANQCGITSIGDVWPRVVYADEGNEILKSMEEEGILTARIFLFPELRDDLGQAKDFRERYTSEKVRFSGLKQLVDGVTEAHTAFFVESYSDSPSERGELCVPADKLEKQIINADKEGFPVRLHTIGDGAVRLSLDCIEKAQKINGKKGLRHALEHIENIQVNDIPRLNELGVVASMQPMHFTSNTEGYPVLIGPERVQRAWAIKTLIDSGAKYAFSSDSPVVDIDPIPGVYSAVTRQNIVVNPEGGFIPKEKISMAETLKGYTAGSAYVENFDDQIGTLEVGKLADLVVLSKNLFQIPDSEILNTKVRLTVMDGRIINKE